MVSRAQIIPCHGHNPKASTMGGKKGCLRCIPIESICILYITVFTLPTILIKKDQIEI